MSASESGSLPAPAPALDAVERLREGGRERRGHLGLDRNERLGALSEDVCSELRDVVTSDLLTSYPMLEDLYDELAADLGLARERLLLTPGSDAAVRAVHQCFVRPGDSTLSLAPSYAMYAVYAQMFGGRAVSVPFDAELRVDPDELLGAVVPGVRLVLIAEPNQPTGTTLGHDLLRELLVRATDAGALMVVDEAYFPFSQTTVLPWVAEHPNLAVTRTFSKAWGLAGVRVGFVAAAAEVIRTLYKVRSAYDVNAFAAQCARVLLRHPEVAAGYAREVAEGRALLEARVRDLGLEPLPSLTNFMLVRVAQLIPPADLVERLHERGIIVKGPFAQPGLSDCIRVTLGPPELMERFAGVLAEVLDAGG